jgi:hypothetical protein
LYQLESEETTEEMAVLRGDGLSPWRLDPDGRTLIGPLSAVLEELRRAGWEMDGIDREGALWRVTLKRSE